MAAYEKVILGGGESGTGAAVLAKKRGYRVFVSDIGKIKKNYKDVLRNHEIPFEEERHSEDLILAAGEMIKSPGIADHLPIVRRAGEKMPVISEIEFAGRYCDAFKICITGSNGKTTTTLLTHHILTRAGINAGMAGNVGKSFAYQVAMEQHDVYVLEMSSFQLDGIRDFRADIAVLTNITPDHLDRYGGDFGKYAGSKMRITLNQTSSDHFIFCDDDLTIRELIGKIRPAAKQWPFTLRQEEDFEGAYLHENKLVIQTESNKLKMTLEELALQGKHNVYNSMAAGIAARLIDIRKLVIKESLADFQHIEHRLELVASIHGVEFINDSKATNVNSTWYALENMNRPVVWIAGGLDKGNDYRILKSMVKEKVKAIVLLGKETKKIRKAFSGVVGTIAEAKTAREAVQLAYHLSERNDVVLLSPACASFDLFDNYEDRGNQFKAAVNSL